MSISPSFPAPTSSTDLNSNNKENYRMTPMIESLRTTQIAFFRFATPSGFLGGGRRRGTKSIRARVRARENLMKPLVRTSFLGTRPSCPPSPGDRFSAQTTKTEFISGQPSNKILLIQHVKYAVKHLRKTLQTHQPAIITLGMHNNI